MNEVMNDFLAMFPNDQSIIHECIKTYTEFQDYLRRQYKNEKNLNNFLIGLPKNSPKVEPSEIKRLIDKADVAHRDVQEILYQFVELVKQECVMDGNYFTFTSLPELIVRKNYPRKQY